MNLDFFKCMYMIYESRSINTRRAMCDVCVFVLFNYRRCASSEQIPSSLINFRRPYGGNARKIVSIKYKTVLQVPFHLQCNVLDNMFVLYTSSLLPIKQHRHEGNILLLPNRHPPPFNFCLYFVVLKVARKPLPFAKLPLHRKTRRT